MKPCPLTLLVTLLFASHARAELVVDLDARTQADGTIAQWTNQGSLGGIFTASGSPTVEAVDGVKGVTYNGSSWHVGPRSTPEMDGDSDRSIQVWVYNPAIAAEETVVSWGHRGGPDGSNISFNHGTHNAFGAVGHWGNGPDIGWDPSETADDADTGLGQEESAIWTNIAYTQTGNETRVFTNGILTTSEEIDINTHANQAIVIAAQQTAFDSDSFAIAGTLTIAKVQVWDTALPDGQIAFNYNQEAANFSRDLAEITDSDGDGLPDDLEAALGLDPNTADADGDLDSDGVPNIDEIRLGSNLNEGDTDGDGLGDAAEIAEGTSLTNSDTDGDGISDKEEIDAGLNPTNIDSDGDGAPDNVERDAGTDPLNPNESPNTIILLRDTTDDESWVTPAVWSSGAAAEAGKQYIITSGAGSILNTPKGQRAAFPEGATLTLAADSARLVLHNSANAHFDDLSLQAGSLAVGSSRAGISGNLALAGEVTVNLTAGQRFNLDSKLSGEGSLTFASDAFDVATLASLSGTSEGFTGEVLSNGVLVEFGGIDPLGTANFSFFEGGIRLITNVLMPESTLGIGGTSFLVDLNGGTAVFKAAQGVDADRDVIFEISPGVYDRAALLGLGFNEDTVGETDGMLVVLGDEGDSDNDGLWDQWETDTFGNLAQTGEGDADGDELSNADEFRAGTDPNKADTDDDTLNDRFELFESRSNPILADSDGDSLGDAEEVNRMVDGQAAPTDPNLADTDGDGLEDGAETNTGTFVSASETGSDPLVADTDGDGWPDGSEVFEGQTDPTDGDDTPDFTPSVVTLDARNLPLGPISSWQNIGGLGGTFESAGNPEVEAINGVNAVTLDGTSWLVGPPPLESMTGNGERSIQAWIFNPDILPEETVFAWGRRNGPDATNMSFNHGTHNAFGAVGHWGNGPDIGWDPSATADDEETGEGREEAEIWTNITYVWTGDTTKVYTNGILSTSEMPGPMNTFAESTEGQPLPMVVGNQNEADGTHTEALAGSLSVATVKVYDRALTDAETLALYNFDASSFGRDPFVPGDSDEDGLPDLWEVNVFGDLSQSGDGDPDEDGVSNIDEESNGTNPNLADTDGDGFTDREELDGGTDPLDVGNFPITLAELLVSLDATTLPEGAIDSWENTGTLAGDFTANEGPQVIAVDGVNGVDFDGAAYFEGPSSTPKIEGRSARTIEAWVHNPELAGEETVVAWSRRGGGAGTNVSFNHGSDGNFGAVGHWGAADIGWNGDEEANIWSHITYTYDGNTTRVYTNGQLSNEEDVVLDTAGGNGILIAAQREGDNETVTGGLRGTMTIAKVRIYDSTLTASEIVGSYNAEAGQFGRELAEVPNVLVVDLDATGLDAGAITEWTNAGSLGGVFTAGGAPQVIAVDGVNGIDFNGTDDYFDGPISPIGITGSNPRTIEAWVHNPEVASEETVVSWGFRGGPDGSNVSFNHGTHNTFGAVGHWGAPDIGWDPTTNGNDDDTGLGHEEEGLWSYVTYTYDGSTTRVYTNGSLTNSEEAVLNTHAGNGILIAAQRDSDGGPVTAGLRGDMTIARVRIWEGALSDEEIAATWDDEADTFGRGPPIATLVELDASNLPNGAIASWVNAGTLGGEFAAQGDPMVETIDGSQGVTLDGTGDWLIGPTSVPGIEGDSARTVEAWVYNPEIAEEETVISWGRRGGPDGSNVSFNHGTHETFGAVGHWGAPDIGWGEEADGPEEAGKWSHIAYSNDGSTTRVYTNGVLTNSEEGITLNTHSGQGIVIGAQWDNETTVNEGLSGSLSVGYVRIYDGALTDAEIATAFELTQPNFAGGGGGGPEGPFVINAIARDDANNVSLSFSTTEGTTYAIQYSEDLVTWTDIMSIDGDGSPASFSDTDAARIARAVGYYRVSRQ